MSYTSILILSYPNSGDNIEQSSKVPSFY